MRNVWVKEAWKMDPAGRRLHPGMKRFDLDMKTVTMRRSEKLSSPILRHFIFTLFFKGTNKAYSHSLDLDITTTVPAMGAALLGMLIERGAQSGFPTPKPGARIPNASITKESWQAAYEVFALYVRQSFPPRSSTDRDLQIYHRQVIAKHESNPDWLAAELQFYLLSFNAVHQPAPSAIDMSCPEDDMDQYGFE
ncbi:hypothetical protein HDU88_004375 [Geranomyces variabilis]|nr:hypothetical protein HDU88_004375 [Geranomyces variabilis]